MPKLGETTPFSENKICMGIGVCVCVCVVLYSLGLVCMAMLAAFTSPFWRRARPTAVETIIVEVQPANIAMHTNRNEYGTPYTYTHPYRSRFRKIQCSSPVWGLSVCGLKLHIPPAHSACPFRPPVPPTCSALSRPVDVGPSPLGP